MPPDKAALNFFTGAIIWFDILAGVSTDCQPFLSDYHDRLLSSSALPSPSEFEVNGTIELHTIMGCQNWAMITIGEIERLRRWREREIRAGTLDIRRVVEKANEIQSRLEPQNSKVLNELNVLRSKYSGPPPRYYPNVYNRHTALIVTHVFASAALIYLQTVVSSDSSILNIKRHLQSVIAAMAMISDPRMFRGLVWPLCVAGCMASSPLDQDSFRKLAVGAIQDSRRFGNSSKALEILQKSWELQQEKG
jgi:C6 transcription factor Pro1